MTRSYRIQIFVATVLFALFLLLDQLQAAPNTSTFTKSLPGKSTSRSVIETDDSNVKRAQDTYQIVVDDGDYRTSGNLTGKATSDAAATVTPFKFDTSVAHTGGNIFEVYNHGVLKWALDKDGTASNAGRTYTFANGITETDGAVALGGTLAADTTVATSTHKLAQRSADYTATPFVGYGVTINPAESDGLSGVYLGAVKQNAVNDRSGTDLQLGSKQAVLSAVSYPSDASDSYDYFVTAGVNNKKAYGAGSYLFDVNGFGPTQFGEFSLSITEPTEARWTMDGEFTLADYLSTRDNTGASTPVNFLYTDSSGNMKAGAVGQIFKGAAPQLGDPGTRPTCDSSVRGTMWYDAGGSGVADSIAICAHKSDNTYAWIAMATIP